MTTPNSPSKNKESFSSSHADFPSICALQMYLEQVENKAVPPLHSVLDQVSSKISEITVLDLGCGLGSNFIYALLYYGLSPKHLLSTDADKRNLAHDERYVRKNKIQSSAERLPFTDNMFDIVHTCMLTPDNPTINYEKILEEISRVLKPDGFYICFESFDKVAELKKQGPDSWKNSQDLLPLVSDDAFLANIGFKPIQKCHYLIAPQAPHSCMFYIFEKH